MNAVETAAEARRLPLSAGEAPVVVKLDALNREEHGAVLCYPGTNLDSFECRLEQLRGLQARELIFEGQSKVGKLGVVGKGCVSVVVKARLDSAEGVAALKIRRVDADRPTMRRDFDMQLVANSAGVGPKALGVTDDLFAMEFIPALKIAKWFEALNSKSSKTETRVLVRKILAKCHRLDLAGLDHGELSNPSKHILIREDTREPVIIDYESASRERKPSNLTAVAQFLFLGSWRGERIANLLEPKSRGEARNRRVPVSWKEQLIRLLREYKAAPNQDAFQEILEYVHCS